MGFEYQYGKKIFSSPKTVQTSSGAHPASYSIGREVLSKGKATEV
jgi:hypothetical protein